MSGSVNKVIIVGNCTRDPDIRFAQSGKKIANLNVATSEKWRDRSSGEQRESTEFHRVVVFNEGLAGVVESYVKKGSKLYIEGQLKTRKWQGQDGKDNYTTEVVLQGFESTLKMLDKNGGGSSNNNSGGYGGQQSGGGTYTGQPVGSPDLDDEIPFSPCFI